MTENTLRYPCRANQCQMPGTIFTGGSGGSCQYHHGAAPTDWPRITQALLDWNCVSAEVNDCRRVLTHPDTMIDAKRQNECFADAWSRLKPAVLGSGWQTELAPKPREQYGDWGKRLEAFLCGRVLAALTPQVGRQAA